MIKGNDMAKNEYDNPSVGVWHKKESKVGCEHKSLENIHCFKCDKTIAEIIKENKTMFSPEQKTEILNMIQESFDESQRFKLPECEVSSGCAPEPLSSPESYDDKKWLDIFNKKVGNLEANVSDARSIINECIGFLVSIHRK